MQTILIRIKKTNIMIVPHRLLQITLCLLILISTASKPAHEATSFDNNQNSSSNYNPDIALLYAICCIPNLGDRAYEINKAILFGANREAIIPGDETGTTALMHSALHSRFNTTSRLLFHHANANAQNTDGSTPLMHAASTTHINSPAIIDMLLRYDADVNAENKKKLTALHYAVLSGNAPATRLLINNRANVNATDIDGISALKMAQQCRHSEIEELLILAGARPIFDNLETVKAALDSEQKYEGPQITIHGKKLNLSKPLLATASQNLEQKPKSNSRRRRPRPHRYAYRHNKRYRTLKEITTTLAI